VTGKDNRIKHLIKLATFIRALKPNTHLALRADFGRDVFYRAGCSPLYLPLLAVKRRL
jgi:hypothetical protein